MIHKRNYTFIMSELLPEGKSGDWSIIKSIMPKGFLLNTYSPAGVFYHDNLSTDFPVVRLVRGSEKTMMSDTPMEQEGLRIPAIQAHGHVLIIGLGIGLLPILLKKHNKLTSKITIVEENTDVANLVYDYIKWRQTKLIISEGKHFLSTCKTKFDYIFIDVWPAIVPVLRNADEWVNLAKQCLDEKGTVRYWLQELHDRIRSRLPKSPILIHGPPAIYDPCLICGKKLRNDYGGVCMDCADELEISELFVRKDKHEEDKSRVIQNSQLH
jgi:hypothetical protein